MRRALALAVTLAACCAAQAARADSAAQRFAAARSEFGYKNFENAAKLLHPLLHPQVQLTAENDIVEARKMLGLAYFYLGDKQRSREEFTALLYLRPEIRLDPFLIPPPAVQFFESIRTEPDFQKRLKQRELEKKKAEGGKDKPEEAPKASRLRKIYLERTREEHWRALTFLPFGIGQFQNNDRTKGIVLAVTGSLALGANVFSGSMRWLLRREDGTYPAEQIDLVEGYRIVQYTALGIFAALWLYGVIDANAYFWAERSSPFETVREESSSEPVETGPSTGFPLGFTF